MSTMLEFTIKNELTGAPLKLDRFNISLKPNEEGTWLECCWRGLYFDNPQCEGEKGQCEALSTQQYEQLTLVFSNAEGKYLMVDATPHGHYRLSLGVLGNGIFLSTSNISEILGESMPDCITKINEMMQIWTGKICLPMSLFPPNCDRFNAYNTYADGDRKVDALYPHGPESNQDEKPEGDYYPFLSDSMTVLGQVLPANLPESELWQLPQ